ncbi:MAG: hypothetical protein F4138_05465 [Acidimicrobiia bacterium]|nr:hypothetical protein [Acidimicrobiia bacterium]
MGEEFRSRTLDELAHFINGYAFKPSDFTENGLPVIRIQQLLDADAETDRFDGQIDSRFMIQTGDIVMSWSGTIAVVEWKRGDAWLNQHLFRVDPRDGVSREFLRHLLSFAVDDLLRAAHGTTMKHITRAELSRFVVLIPSLGEQRRIAEVLDTVEEGIQATKRVISKISRIREATIDDLLSGLDPHLDSCLADVLQDPLCYGIVQVGEYVSEGIPVVAIRDLNGDFGLDLHRTSTTIDEQYPRSRVQGGEVLLSIKGTIGKVGLVPRAFRGNISRDIALLRPNAKVKSAYLAHFLQSHEGQRRLRRIAVGTTRAELSIHALRDVPVSVPDSSEQCLIAEIVGNLDAWQEEEFNRLSKLRQLQKGLSADLISGRVRTVAA